MPTKKSEKSLRGASPQPGPEASPSGALSTMGAPLGAAPISAPKPPLDVGISWLHPSAPAPTRPQAPPSEVLAQQRPRWPPASSASASLRDCAHRAALTKPTVRSASHAPLVCQRPGASASNALGAPEPAPAVRSGGGPGVRQGRRPAPADGSGHLRQAHDPGARSHPDAATCSPSKPYRVTFVGSIARAPHRASSLIDIDRDGKVDERWELKQRRRSSATVLADPERRRRSRCSTTSPTAFITCRSFHPANPSIRDLANVPGRPHDLR